MKITTFNPQIITDDPTDIIKVFEDLGFKKSHNPKGLGIYNVDIVRMKDENGFHVDIAQPDIDLTRDVMAIRMNVDNFDEAYELLQSRGFKNIYMNKTVNTKSSKSAVMLSPSGLAINLVQHIKD